MKETFKFQLGQKVFRMESNKVVSRTITHRAYRDDNVGDEIEVRRHYFLMGVNADITEDTLFATKEELLASL